MRSPHPYWQHTDNPATTTPTLDMLQAPYGGLWHEAYKPFLSWFRRACISLPVLKKGIRF
jgi:hypothetical protein